MTSKIDWHNGMELIDKYCYKIIETLKTEELSLLDLARCAARFCSIGKLFQDTIDRLQDDINADLRKKGKDGTNKKGKT